jgi:hypothetical protein
MRNLSKQFDKQWLQQATSKITGSVKSPTPDITLGHQQRCKAQCRAV